MASDPHTKSRWADVEFAGDVMVLSVPASAMLGAALGNGLAPFGLMGIGVVIGLVLGPPAATALALVLRDERLTGHMWGDLALSAVGVTALLGAAYGTVVASQVDRLAAFSTTMGVLLAIEALGAAAVVAAGVSDLLGGRRHRALDVLRAVVCATMVIASAVLVASPDVAEALIIIAPVALAGALTGFAYRLTARLRHHAPSAAGRSPGAPV